VGERDQVLARLPPRAKPEINRFKGHGEMPPQALFETTLDPSRRRLLRVALPDVELAEATIGDLMGKDPSRRYSFIMDRAGEVDDVDV
jgi:DNA gyrase subunit B/topoisomerase-4 subunit B